MINLVGYDLLQLDLVFFVSNIIPFAFVFSSLTM